MNERMLELAKEAEWLANRGDNVDVVVMMEKFAELIVRECADICINENVSNLDMNVIFESGKFTLQDLATKSCGENLSKQIKKHFGVEDDKHNN